MTTQELASLFLGGDSPEQVEKLLDSITDLVQSVRPDGSFAYVNRAWRQTLGYSAPRIDRMKVFDVIHESSRDKCRTVFERLLSGQTVPPFETIFVNAEGGLVELEGNATCTFEGGRPVLIRAVLRDVSERHRIERRFRASEERFRTLVEEASDGIFLADNTGQISYASPSLKRVLGFAPEELLGTSGFALVHPDDVPAAQEYFGRVLAQPREHLTLQCRVRHKDLGWRELEVVCTNHLDDAAVEAIVVNFRDVTEQKAAEERRRLLEEQMQHAQKLESLGVLAGGIAHDFNNLLTVIVGNAELARPHVVEGSSGHEFLTNLEVAARRAADLTREMLAYAGRTPLAREICDVSAIVLEMSELLSTVISKSTPLDLDLAPQPLLIDADPTQIRQVIMNLITNASESYRDRVGSVRVVTTVMTASAEYLHSPYIAPAPPPGAYVSVEVRDNGVGMSEQILPRIFEPFFTTNFIGRGLGLAATLGIVRGHGGTIQVASAPGRGTTVRMLLPLASAEKPTARESGTVDAWKASGTLIVVDDEEAVRQVAYEMLTRAGFTVLLASDGEAAASFLREHASVVRAVLLDVTMPVPGPETLIALRDVHPEVPVLLMSGYTEENISDRYSEQLWSGFIQKPFALADVLRVLRNVLEA